jgi:hypothetical protein
LIPCGVAVAHAGHLDARGGFDTHRGSFPDKVGEWVRYPDP